MIHSIRFELKSDKKAKKKLIYALISYNNRSIMYGENTSKPLKYSTGLKIEPEYWNKKKQEAKNTYIQNHSRLFNIELNGFKKQVEDVFYELEKEGINMPPYIAVRQKLNELRKGVKTVKSDSLIDFIDDMVKFEKSKTINPLGNSTIEKYEILLDQLKLYEKKIKLPLTFDRLNRVIYNGFFEFINKEYIKETGDGYAANTLNGKQKKLNKILKSAKNQGYNVNFDFMDKSLKYSADKVNHVYINFDELNKMIDMDKDVLKKQYEIARDFFFIMTLCGLRYSGLKILFNNTVKKGKLKSGKTFYYVEHASKKTGIDTAVPILAPVLKIYRENNDKFPIPPVSQTINNNIKKVALLAKINDEMVLKIKRNNTVPTKTSQKWEHVSCHTARRSFISNFAQYIPQSVVSKITHPNRRAGMFDVYNKISAVENVKLFFKYIYDVEEFKWLVDY